VSEGPEDVTRLLRQLSSDNAHAAGATADARRSRAHFFGSAARRILELRFMNVAKIAEVMEISAPTVKRECASSRAWLYHGIAGGANGAGKMAGS
jgi:hypothetical protein